MTRDNTPVSRDFANHLAYFVCPMIGQQGWLPYQDLRLPIDDLGFRQGVTAVERLRTYACQPFHLDAHLARFDNTMRLIGIEGVSASATLRDLVLESLSRNTTLLSTHGQVGITLWATPGSSVGAPPTFAIHLNRIDHEAVDSRRRWGQAVVLTDVVQPVEESWARHAKVRCRLHYYLADRRADSIVPGATGVLQDSDGSWTESSIANIAVLCGREIVFAPPAQVLPGVTQAHVVDRARHRSLATRRAPLTTAMISDADAILLMGTDTGLWFASGVVDVQGHKILGAPRDTAAELIAELQAQF